ncbi:bacterial transcriptional activator domain-containing protein [Allosalinactinospora lopnorensis]|uniref:bacterial transcriptional activator domain-containing protein n=1 Tax=Allosalinactinospora lopnorensis TaxID=1352348 RepID=UPI0006985945|nr:bacterial transcriptional activator domain-containing protein [Allosalinactinospora lopnorensis]
MSSENESGTGTQAGSGIPAPRIAWEHTGDADGCLLAFAAGNGQQRPDDLQITDFRPAAPGRQLTITGDGGEEEPIADEAGDRTRQKQGGGPAGEEPPASAPEPPEPDSAVSGSAPPAGNGTATPEPNGATADPEAAGTAQATGPEPAPTSEEDTAVAPDAAGYSGLLAAECTALLGFRRRVQLRRRKPGHRIACTGENTLIETEEAMRHNADPASVELLDQALRSLAACAAETGRDLPVLAGARLTARGCELLLADAEGNGAVGPFQHVGLYSWALDREHEALLPPHEARAVPAPYPGLVTLGSDATGAHVLIDTVHTGAVNLTGDPEQVEEVLWALALELGTSRWSDHCEVTVVGFGAELPAATRTLRIRHTTTFASCLDETEQIARELRASPERVEECVPHIVLSAQPISSENMLRLRDAIVSAPHLPLAVITAATSEQCFPTEWTLDCTPGADVTLPDLGRSITLQRLSAEQRAKTTHLLVSAQSGSRPDHDWAAVPAEPPGPVITASGLGGAETAQGDHTALRPPVPRAAPGYPCVRVLGPVDITCVDPATLEPGKRRSLIELACLLALKPGQTPDQISRVLGGPRGPWSASTRSTSLSRLRSWFGRDAKGDPFFPTLNGRGYALADTVGCDWIDFQALALYGIGNDTPAGNAALHQALDLVRGEPFAGTPPDRYLWAEPLKPTIIAALADAAHTLAVRYMISGDLERGRDALVRILETDPANELLYRDLLRIEYRNRDPEAVQRTVHRLTAALDERDLEMEPETIALIEQMRF